VVWVQSKAADYYTTEGINPLMVSNEEFDLWLRRFIDQHLMQHLTHIEHIYFFGAGCMEGAVQRAVQSHFARHFPSAFVQVGSDILATRFAVDPAEPAIIGILGTGANACYFDGRQIQLPVPALGYLLGDEGSGADLGKTLLKHVLRRSLPEDLLRDFYHTYPKEPAQILRELYGHPKPNLYLARYARFVYRHRTHPAVRPWLLERLHRYVRHHLLPIMDTYDVREVYLTGGVAAYFKSEVEEVLHAYGGVLRGTCERPIEGLVKYLLQHGVFSH